MGQQLVLYCLRQRFELRHEATTDIMAAEAYVVKSILMDEGFDDRDLDALRDITARLGLADVREFGLTWEDCEGYLSRLG